MKFTNLIMAILVMTSSCAFIVKKERQMVTFRGGPEKGTTKVITPDGVLDIESGSGSYLLTRTRSDIPLKVICPDGTTKHAIAETSFDWIAGGLGNWWSYFLAIGVDAFVDNAYDIEDVSLTGYCKEKLNLEDNSTSSVNLKNQND